MAAVIAFAEARLAEDEAPAKAAQLRFPGPWEQAENTNSPLLSAVTLYDSRDESVGVIRGSYAAAHIARHDPARTLREIEAKRRILERHRGCGDGFGYCADGGHDRDDGGCAELADALSAWSDHPDYPQELKP